MIDDGGVERVVSACAVCCVLCVSGWPPFCLGGKEGGRRAPKPRFRCGGASHANAPGRRPPSPPRPLRPAPGTRHLARVHRDGVGGGAAAVRGHGGGGLGWGSMPRADEKSVHHHRKRSWRRAFWRSPKRIGRGAPRPSSATAATDLPRAHFDRFQSFDSHRFDRAATRRCFSQKDWWRPKAQDH